MGPEESAGTFRDQPSVPSSASSAVVKKQDRRETIAESSSPGAAADRDQDRVVRVTAESLSRLMGLAGEALVQTHRLRPLVDALWRLKGRQTGLLETLHILEDRMSSREDGLTATDREQLAKAKARAAEGLQELGETVEALKSSPASARTSPAGCTTKCWPAGCGRWPTASAAFRALVRDMARELGKQARFEVDRRDHRRRSRHPRPARGAAQPPDPQRRWTTASKCPRIAELPANPRWAPSAWRLAIARGCSRSS